MENETLKTAARANTLENFRHVFERMLEGFSSTGWKVTEEIFDRIMQDASFRDAASSHLVRGGFTNVFRRAQRAEPGSTKRHVVKT